MCLRPDLVSDKQTAHRASLLTAVLAEVLPGVLCVRGVQREFEDLLAVLIFSPVRGNKLGKISVLIIKSVTK